MWWLLPLGLVLLMPLRVLNQKSRFTALLVWLAVAFYVFMPEKARQSAPFHQYAPSEIAYFSCSSHLRPIQFCEPGSEIFSSQEHCMCTNENAMATVSHCYFTAYPQLANCFVERCNSRQNTLLTTQDFEQAHEYYKKSARKDHDQSKVVQNPVELNESAIFRNRDAYDQFLGNYNRSINYGLYLVAYWGIAFTIVGLMNWLKVWFPRFCARFKGRSSNWIRKNITLRALIGKLKASEKPFLQVLDLLVPARLETILLGGFAVLTVYLSFSHIKYVEGDPIFPSKLRAYARYYAVRTGILASWLLPFCVVFAGRNNILQWAVRWEYAAFVTLHRWISRVIVLLIAVHACGYTYMLYSLRHARGLLLRPYVWWGTGAGIAGLFLVIHSLLVLRRNYYETFLVLHIFLALGFIVGAWIHVDDLYFLWFYYFSAFLWGSDRLLRLQRIFAFGFPVAKVQLFEDQTLKFFVPRPAGFGAEGGGHCFVHFLRPLIFWQSHPFDYSFTDSHIIFYVKVKEGVTRDLAKWLEDHPDRNAHIRVAVEGSYGDSTPANKYQSSVFVAGGNGIPGIYAEAIEVSELRPVHSNRKVKLIWIVRHYDTVLWFYDELQALSGSQIEVEIYVTRPSEQLLGAITDKLPLLHNTYLHDHHIDVQKNPVRTLKNNLGHIKFSEGRPDLEKIVLKNVEESLGSICFVTCGHPQMVDELRHQVVEAINEKCPRIDFYEQLQVWA